MRGIPNQEDASLPELLGHQLSGLPVRDAYNFEGQVWLPDSFEGQLLAPFSAVILRRFFLDQKHPAIAVGDQEETADIRPINEDRVILVAADQLASVSPEVDKDIVLIQHS